jgi:hypothetical protein
MQEAKEMKLCKDCVNCVNDRCQRMDAIVMKSPITGNKRRYFPDCVEERKCRSWIFLGKVFGDAVCGMDAKYFRAK